MCCLVIFFNDVFYLVVKLGLVSCFGNVLMSVFFVVVVKMFLFWCFKKWCLNKSLRIFVCVVLVFKLLVFLRIFLILGFFIYWLMFVIVFNKVVLVKCVGGVVILFIILFWL